MFSMSKRIFLVLAASAALAGCARWDERFHGSWLDTYGVPPLATPQMVAEPQASELRTQITQLKAQAEAIRVKMASEKDREKRFVYLRQLEAIGDKERPLDDLLHLGPTKPALPSPDPSDPGA